MRGREISDPDDKAFAMRLLCQIGEPYAIAKCQELVADEAQPQARRDEAARALCLSGDARAVDMVVTIYASHKGTHRHLALALALERETAAQAALVLRPAA